MTYPAARRDPQPDTYFGTQVPDPYRWLEDADSPETTAWVQAENQVTFAYLAQSNTSSLPAIAPPPQQQQ